MTSPAGPPGKTGPPTPAAKPKPKPKRTPAPGPGTPPPPVPPRWRWVMPAGFLVALIALFIVRPGSRGAPAQKLSYTGFVSDVTANKVSTAAIDGGGAVSGKLTSGKDYTSQIPTALNDSSLPSLLAGHKVQVTGTAASSGSTLGLILTWILPLVLIVVVFIWLRRRGSQQLGGRLGGIMAFGK